MATIQRKLTMYRGESKTFDFATGLDISDLTTIVFTMKLAYDSTNLSAKQYTAVIEDASVGSFTVTISDVGLTGSPAGHYVYDVMGFGEGIIQELFIGQLEILPIVNGGFSIPE